MEEPKVSGIQMEFNGKRRLEDGEQTGKSILGKRQRINTSKVYTYENGTTNTIHLSNKNGLINNI